MLIGSQVNISECETIPKSVTAQEERESTLTRDKQTGRRSERITEAVGEFTVKVRSGVLN